jgi:hypothetical protein
MAYVNPEVPTGLTSTTLKYNQDKLGHTCYGQCLIVTSVGPREEL